MAKHIINEQGQGFNCEGTCECITPVFGTGQYQTETDCINDTNCCKRWKCDQNGLGVCEAVNDMSAPYENETDCLAAHPNGCTPTQPDVCCTVWVCVDDGPNNKCCKSLELCKPPGAPMGTNYPTGFPWHLVESSSVPPKEFNRILNENLILEWMCNMDWVVHFGIWLSSTKLACEEGAPWISFQGTQGGTGCGPCSTPITLDDKFALTPADAEAKDGSKGNGVTTLNKWKEEGRVKPINEDFYINIIKLVEEVYHTQKLLKG